MGWPLAYELQYQFHDDEDDIDPWYYCLVCREDLDDCSCEEDDEDEED